MLKFNAIKKLWGIFIQNAHELMYKNDSTERKTSVPIDKFRRRQSRLILPLIPESNIIDSLCNSLKTGTALDREPKEHALITAVTGNNSVFSNVVPFLFSWFTVIKIINLHTALLHFKLQRDVYRIVENQFLKMTNNDKNNFLGST